MTSHSVDVKRRSGASSRPFRFRPRPRRESKLAPMTLAPLLQAPPAITLHAFAALAAFPLAIPLMAGPGAITATVLLAAQAGGRPVFILVLVGVILVVIGLCLAMFLFASRIGPLLGITANVVLSRLLGVLLAALAVQFVIDGIRAVLSG